MVKHSHPEFHKSLLVQSAYPSAPRRIKFEESRRSFLYRTGTHLYKIRKISALYSSLAVKERFIQEALVLGQHWAGDVVEAVRPVVQTPAGFSLVGEGTVVDHALELTQLSDHFWLDRLVAQNKITPTAIGRLGRFLSDHHKDASEGGNHPKAGRPEQFEELMEEIFYQSKKYISRTLSEPMLDMVTRPLTRFVGEFRKLFLRRLKRGKVVDGHGAFIPEHIYIRGMDIRAFSPLDGQPKYRVLDVANDVALLMNGLLLLGADDLAGLFLKRYLSASHDRELPRILPAYQTLQAMRKGMLQSEWLAELEDEDPSKEEVAARASAYFNLAVQAAKEIPRPE